MDATTHIQTADILRVKPFCLQYGIKNEQVFIVHHSVCCYDACRTRRTRPKQTHHELPFTNHRLDQQRCSYLKIGQITVTAIVVE